MMACPSCKYPIIVDGEGQIHVLPVLPMGAKFEPTDQEILGHLEAKIVDDGTRLHPLIKEFIPTLEGGSGIWYTHPERLPGVKIDGQICHFFYRTSKAYSTGTQKQGKVHTGVSIEGKPWWHKTGMAMPILVDGRVKGFKKIFVLYTNSGRKKLEKTNWVMHQYHLGNNEEEKEGEFIFLKVFYQTQTAHCEMKNSDQEMESSTTSNNCKCSH